MNKEINKWNGCLNSWNLMIYLCLIGLFLWINTTHIARIERPFESSSNILKRQKKNEILYFLFLEPKIENHGIYKIFFLDVSFQSFNTIVLKLAKTLIEICRVTKIFGVKGNWDKNRDHGLKRRTLFADYNPRGRRFFVTWKMFKISTIDGAEMNKTMACKNCEIVDFISALSIIYNCMGSVCSQHSSTECIRGVMPDTAWNSISAGFAITSCCMASFSAGKNWRSSIDPWFYVTLQREITGCIFVWF